MDLKNFEAASGIRDANVDLTIEATESAKGRIDGVRSVGGCHDHNIGSGFHTVHEGEKLRHDTALDFAVCLLTLGGDGVDLINEDDGRRVLLCFLKSFAQVGLRFTSHL